MRSFAILTLILLIACGAVWLLKEATHQYPPQDWNEGGIAWQTFDAGLKQAQAEHKPICLVFYADWCPHCRNFGKVFRDPEIIRKSEKFVMIRVNVDDHRELSNAFGPDGTYIPRTYFLSPQGVADNSLTAYVPPPPQYKYFYDENSPASLSAGMDRALKKLQ